MAPLEWTCSVGAVRDTPVGDYSAPGIKIIHPIAYCPAIEVSLCLLAVSVAYLKWPLWHCGHLRPYIGIGSLGTRLYFDWNAMSDGVKISPPVHYICTQNAFLSLLIIYIIRSHQINVAIDNQALIPSVSSLTPSCNLWNYVCAAGIVSHAENMHCKSSQWFNHLYKFWDGIQGTQVFRYCGELQV